MNKPKDIPGMAAASLQAGMTIKETCQLAANVGRPMTIMETRQLAEIRRVLRRKGSRALGF